MDALDKYQAAKKDISLNKHPYRQHGHMQWTPGHRHILRKKIYNDLRVFNQEINKLQNAKEEKVRKMLLYQTPFEDREAHHTHELSKLQKQLHDTVEKYTLKETERYNIIEDLRNRGIQLEQQTDEDESPKPSMRKKNLFRIFTVILIYLVIEVFIYITQYESQRDIKSYEEIGARVLAMFILVGAFHIVAHMNRLSKKIIYSLYLGFNILLITTMMFAPPVMHFAYPEQHRDAGSSGWSLVEHVSDTEAASLTEEPAWIALYRKMEWAPAGIGIIVFLVVFFAIPNPMFQKHMQHRAEEQGSGLPANKESDEHSWFQKELKSLNIATSNLKEERNKLRSNYLNMRNHSADILPIRNELQKIKKSILDIDEKIVTLKIKKEELYHDLETELNEYRVEFESLLANDPIKHSVMKPEWPTRQDILQHFKVASL